MANEEDIRRKLEEVLVKDPYNYDKIQMLSSKLIAFDPLNIRFSVDGGVIHRLGRELVARQETAVSELVKNAYDADATRVELIFENAETQGGALRIIDDGHGMNREELINGFMKISSTGKIHEPFSPIFQRPRAGRKGIGRFATQRLGTKLTIISKKKGEVGVKVLINWEKYENDTDLFSITNKIEEDNFVEKIGTSLVIENLRDKWTEATIKRNYRYITELIQPIPLSEVRKKEVDSRSKKVNDPGFTAVFYNIVDGKQKLIADKNKMILDYAVAEIEGHVDKDGNGMYSIQSEKLGIDEVHPLGKDKEDPISRFWYLKNASFKAHYFLYSVEFIPRNQLRNIQRLSQERGGIRLYRNGFRVLPYGEPYDDWLRLDESERRRIVLARHPNQNFFGFAEITDYEGIELEETSSREYLLSSHTLSELQDFIYRALIASVIRVAAERGVKQRTGQKDWEKKFDRPSKRVSSIAEELSKEARIIKEQNQIDRFSGRTQKEVLENIMDNREKTSEILDEFASELRKVSEEQRELDSQVLEEIGMLRVLSSLGLSIGIFTHEVRHNLVDAHAALKLLVGKITNNKDALDQSKDLERAIKVLRDFAAYFDRSVSENVTRELSVQNLGVVIEEFLKVITADSSRRGTEILTPEIESEYLLTTPMHNSEWTSILLNLYTNSQKAIYRAKVKGKILIRAGKSGNSVFLEFLDNGDGIDESIENRVFDAFFTTSSPAGHFASVEEELTGTGLGLKIIKDIVSSYQGKIYLDRPLSGYSTCFRIEIPKAKREDLKK